MESSKDVGRRPAFFHGTSLALLVLAPTFVFFMTSLVFFLAYHSSPWLAWLFVIIFLGLSVLLMLVKRQEPQETFVSSPPRPRFWLKLGLLCFLAVAFGTSLSLLNFDRNLGMYYAYEGQRKYTNVLPSEPALSHLDAGQISFNGAAKLDLTKAFGYSGRQGTYCVAPVLDTRNPSGMVHYWAAGLDCCSSSGSFNCNDAQNSQAHEGLVILAEDETEKLDGFREAAKQAAAKYQLTAGKDALFMHWTDNATRAVNSYHNSATAFFIISVILYVVFSVGAGMFLHFGTGQTKKKPPPA
mmetsp:Transcript_65310/g.142280  ORF Transcript_65310/g.142280 Transcript_65310/m.142280 type:complete len:298 (+) Transcript_65310:128-1021(+)|eukprot:CAMPEP_0170593542 /NCGR_PEP_ID=MMETSP0224-20130122/13506_1 /TAXON_ID=285029 /ORGANISM="Togula jolla, Strain CCCM 725" /LENGTH=297 /DNA_ID=CAMNT_0010917507 /DNA_START=107 /DNA_END=1000 /DNA_ORIENTATION=-